MVHKIELQSKWPYRAVHLLWKPPSSRTGPNWSSTEPTLLGLLWEGDQAKPVQLGHSLVLYIILLITDSIGCYKAWHVIKCKSSLNFADELLPRTKGGNFFFFLIKIIPSWYPPGITIFFNKIQPSFTWSKALGRGRVLQEQGPLKALLLS
jgi:hypothetical protein